VVALLLQKAYRVGWVGVVLNWKWSLMHRASTASHEILPFVISAPIGGIKHWLRGLVFLFCTLDCNNRHSSTTYNRSYYSLVR